MNIFQKIGHGFSVTGKAIGHLFQGHSSDVTAQIKALVVSGVEAASHLDLNGDGKVENLGSLIALATRDGIQDSQWLIQLGVDLGIPKLAALLPEGILRSSIVKANIAGQLEKIVGDKVKNSTVNLMLETAVSELKTVTADPGTKVPPTPADVAVVVPPPDPPSVVVSVVPGGDQTPPAPTPDPVPDQPTPADTAPGS